MKILENTPTTKYDYIIVGAGLSGATFARLLTDDMMLQPKVLVIEKRDMIGGNCADMFSKEYGNNYHQLYGAHIFRTSSKNVWDFVNRFSNMIPFNHKVLVNYYENLYSFPINLLTLNQLYGFQQPAQVTDYLEKMRTNIKEPKNLKEQCTNMIGTELFNIFIKGYTEKQWGCSCEELPADIIKRIPVRTTANDSYFDNSKIYQGMPSDGYSALITKMLDDCDVILNEDFLSKREYYESICRCKIIYTGPIDEFFNTKLDWRSLKFEDKYIKDIDYAQATPVVNYTSKDVPYTRVIEHKQFMPLKANQHGTLLTYEYPETYEDGKEKYYPINNDKNKEIVNELKSKIPQKYIFLGRLAEYAYYDMDVAIEKAFNAYLNMLNS